MFLQKKCILTTGIETTVFFYSNSLITLAIMFSVGRLFMNNFGINAIWFEDIVSLDLLGYIYMVHTHARLMSLLPVTHWPTHLLL